MPALFSIDDWIDICDKHILIWSNDSLAHYY